MELSTFAVKVMQLSAQVGYLTDVREADESLGVGYA